MQFRYIQNGHPQKVLRGQNEWFINFSTYLPENNIHCSLSFRWQFHLFLMSSVDRQLPNSDEILGKESPSVLILSIVASTSAVQVILLGNPVCTSGYVMPDDFFNSLYPCFW
jgi:hypothetical protein